MIYREIRGQYSAQELGDVMIYLLIFAGKFDIDLTQAANEKLPINAQEYPVEKAKGCNSKYTEL